MNTFKNTHSHTHTIVQNLAKENTSWRICSPIIKYVYSSSKTNCWRKQMQSASRTSTYRSYCLKSLIT